MTGLALLGSCHFILVFIVHLWDNIGREEKIQPSETVYINEQVGKKITAG